jgi:hypothetical protein
VFDWIGLPRDQVQFVTEGLSVAALHVAPQAEALSQVAPKASYLRMVEDWALYLVPVPAQVLYVSRLGLPQVGGGAHAGEAYLVDRLSRLGVPVLDPAACSIGAQMAAYAGARRLIFSEGSALHGRQLLGRLDQKIEVLRRRPGKMMARAALRPRCRSLTYHDVSAGSLMAYWKTGKRRPNPALSLYDVAGLMQVFQGFGIDLASVWDGAAFATAARVDIAAWTHWHQPGPDRVAEYQTVLEPLGLA